MAPITFGSMTMPASMPRGLTTVREPGLRLAGFMGEQPDQIGAGSTGAGRGTPLTADVAADYRGIRANMEQPQNRSLLGKIADFIVNRKLDNAV